MASVDARKFADTQRKIAASSLAAAVIVAAVTVAAVCYQAQLFPVSKHSLSSHDFSLITHNRNSACYCKLFMCTMRSHMSVHIHCFCFCWLKPAIFGPDTMLLLVAVTFTHLPGVLQSCWSSVPVVAVCTGRHQAFFLPTGHWRGNLKSTA